MFNKHTGFCQLFLQRSRTLCSRKFRMRQNHFYTVCYAFPAKDKAFFRADMSGCQGSMTTLNRIKNFIYFALEPTVLIADSKPAAIEKVSGHIPADE